MKVLIDTSTFLWWDGDTDKLSVDAYDMVEDEGTTVYLSFISIWEIQIKSQLSKLQLRLPLKQLVQEQMRENNILLLPLTEAHIYGLSALPHHHRDPFDRLLISQAKIEKLTLVTNDPRIQEYGVEILW